jgi:pyrroline-5-carboxylate reductase
MGSAVLSGILRGNLDESPVSKFIACVQSEHSARKLRTQYKDHLHHLTILHADNLKAFREADIFILGFKPNMAKAILGASGVGDALRGKLVISLLAGNPPYKLEQLIYNDPIDPVSEVYTQRIDRSNRCRITRVIPNMAAHIGESMTIIEDPPPDLGQEDIETTRWIFGQIGQVRFIAPEVFDVGGALVGASTAFMTIAFEGLLDGAVSEGIKRDEAKEMLAQAVIGMAKLLAAGEHPAVLREQTSSPRGMTIRGLMALEAGNVRSSYSNAILVATARAREL